MAPPPQSHVLTLKSTGGLLRALETECGVCAAYDPAALPVEQRPPFARFTAIWDTGATVSLITQQVVDAAGLKPIGMTQVMGVHGLRLAELFLVNIRLPNGLGFSNVTVTKGEMGATGSQVLIGMDIITRGDFSITNNGGSTVFSFRVPSIGTTDFVKEHDARLKRSGGGPPQRGVIPPGKHNHGKGKKGR